LIGAGAAKSAATKGSRGARSSAKEGVRSGQQDFAAEIVKRQMFLQWMILTDEKSMTLRLSACDVYSHVAVHRLDDIWIASETFANASGIVAGLSQQMTRLGEYREVLFWLLLLGSWQFLASPGAKGAVVGASGRSCSYSSRSVISAG
jgi:hypothetical protein